MSSVNLKTNINFLVIFLCVIFLAFVEGGNVSKSFFDGKGIMGNEVQQIAFILLTLIIIIMATLNPEKAYLTAYSAATLGLIVVISSFYNVFVMNKNGYAIVEMILGFVLIVTGVMMGRTNSSDKEVAAKAIENYKKSLKKK
ncbi:hypothetical protein J4405_01665 [Candidatus Woesearchaeota archaeon]|nr:hypothetical protein [Candidatus Woesearchaeota archaeon]